MEDIFYETPRIPMFILQKEFSVVRVRAIRWVHGKFDGFLTDWDVNNLAQEFYGLDETYEEAVPFYCLYRDKMGSLILPYGSIDTYLTEFATKYQDCVWSPIKIIQQVFETAKLVGCPIFDSIEEARMYVFKKQ